MKDGKAYLLVDTNVWLATYLPNRPRQRESLDFFVQARSSGAELLYAVTAVRDVFYLVGKTLKAEARAQTGMLSQADAQAIQRLAWGAVDNMCEMGTAVGADMSDVWLASHMRSMHGDLEDNLVRAAVQRAEADLLVTWDKGLLSQAIVPTVTPQDALAWLKAQQL